MFYAVLISSKDRHPGFTIKVNSEDLTNPLPKKSFYVTHLVGFFQKTSVVGAFNSTVKPVVFRRVISKIKSSIFAEI